MTKSDLAEIRGIIRSGESFLVAGHVNPDGDTLGCVCALVLTLERWGKRVVAVSPDGVPDLYTFIPGSDRVVTEAPAGMTFDVALVVDCETLDRMGAAKAALASCGVVVEIDHHPGMDGRGSGPQLIQPTAASTGEIVYDILAGMGAHVDREIAECLLTAVVTDTGSFRFTNVTPQTLRVAAELVEAGATTSSIAQRVYDSRPFGSVKLLGLILSTVQTDMDGKIAYACNRLDFQNQLPGGPADAEGAVSYVRSITGVRVGMLFTEVSGEITRVSLRSREGFDVSVIARRFGGGGHKAAAGCTVEKPLAEAVEAVLGVVKQCMVS